SSFLGFLDCSFSPLSWSGFLRSDCFIPRSPFFCFRLIFRTRASVICSILRRLVPAWLNRLSRFVRLFLGTLAPGLILDRARAGFCEDITERRRAGQLLENSEATLPSALFEAARDGI